MSLSSRIVPSSRSVRQILRVCRQHPQPINNVSYRGLPSVLSSPAVDRTNSYRCRLSQARFLSDKDSSTQEETAAEETQEEEPVAEKETVETGEPQEEISRAEVLEKEVKDLKDQLLRSLAEQENTRRIAQKDVSTARNFAVTSFAKSLLETSDNLTRALEAVPEEYRQDREHHAVLATLYEGIQMTDEGLTKAFAKNGLKKFGEAGEVFDPNRHEALLEYPDPNSEPGTVGQVMKVGFILNDRVIRPAEVGVIKKVE